MYMNRIIIGSIFTFCYISLSCHAQTVQSITFNLKEDIPLSLNELIESVEFIPLENTDTRIPESSLQLRISPDRIYLWNLVGPEIMNNSNSPVLIFDQNGKHILTFDKQGKGPGEYLHLKDIVLNPQNGNLHIGEGMPSRSGIMIYDANGNFLRKQEIGYGFEEFAILDSDRILFHTGFSSGDQYAKLIVQNVKTGKKEKYFTLNPDKQNALNIESAASLSPSTDGSYLYIPTLENTIYRVGNGKPVPLYFLDFGPYNVKREMIESDLRIDQLVMRLERENRAFCLGVVESESYLIISFFLGSEKHIAFYHKQKQELSFSKEWKDNVIHSKSILSTGANNIVYAVVPAYDFLDLAEEISPDVSYAQTMKTVASRLRPEDNPVVVIMKLKE